MEPDAVGSVDRVEHGSDTAVRYDFSANCNPRIPDGTRDVYRAAFERARSYPGGYDAFRRAAAAFVGCAPQQVIPTAGGMAAIRLTIETTVTASSSVLVPTPSFGEYAREVHLQDATPVFVPFEELLTSDPGDHALVVVPTPNNPTGGLPGRDELLAFVDRCRSAGTVVLVDEAFLGFTDQSSLAGTPGVVVARSLTKLFGLPGLRMGYAVATGGMNEQLHNAVEPWAMGVPSAAVGAHCLAASEFVTRTRERVRRERKRLTEALSVRFEVAPSRAPFLLVDVGDDPGPDSIRRSLRAAGIAVRDGTTFRGLDTHIRIAVRTSEENTRLIDALLDV
ncbi:aminotransferase class I/II-fold pyridoxal phosphate-dependent enzyme [Halocatena pleomorpha]|uniref:Aminotransferase n=1 Tax=Halocatena pleomorpha TaxID=1785090 RepID=A0A3P3RI99_9EURY|nr:aminotransferase class I/II-fold pyridoxal phosphate-dependent enzyme [Halocatena pleomorpha]RRJ32500.1 aminotransferase class I/II-fold pyridoxal phosphate-dependent enzyme [Halocatena pleomorpha]